MSITSNIVVQDPVDPRELFTAARQAAGLPAAHQGWHLRDYGDTHMLQTRRHQGAAAQVSVHFAPGGGKYLADKEDDQPDGYALVSFETSGSEPQAARSCHERLILALGGWLTGRGLRWCWRFEEDVWVAGHLTRPRPT